MVKLALVLHGWPQKFTSEHELWKLLEKRGYEVLAPYFFDKGFVFREENLISYLQKKLRGRLPEVIVGISLGGYLTFHLARVFPGTKLVFVASGIRLGAKSAWFNWIVRVADSSLGMGLTRLVYALPKSWARWAYGMVNPYSGDGKSREEYVQDRENNLGCILGIKPEKQREILIYLRWMNGKRMDIKLPNLALILVGEKDLFMPPERGQELRKLLPNSHLIITNGEHFNVLNKQTLADVEKFIIE